MQHSGFSLPVVPTTEIFLQPQVEADEQVAAAHFLDFQFGYASSAVAPGNRHDGPGIAANDGLHRNLNRKVEVSREQRLATFNHLAAIRLERIRGVIQRNAEQHGNEEIRHTIDPQLEPRIIDDSSALHKPRTEYRIPALIENVPVAHDV